METLSVINLMPNKKAEVSRFANDIISQVKGGNLNPLTLKAQLKFIEKTIAEVDKGIKDEFMNEAAKYGKSFEYNGWKIEAMESGTTYDYSSDAEWCTLKEKIKERETFLKSLKAPLEVVNTDTGETTTIVPPIKKSTSTYKFSAI